MANLFPEGLEQTVPVALAGVRSLRCECGWEITVILPEEYDIQLTMLLTHLQWYHRLVVPQVLVQNH